MGKSDNYYAVARGRKVGVYRTWNECKAQVDGFQNARYKKFGSESEANEFIRENSGEVQQAMRTAQSSGTSSLPLSRKRLAPYALPSEAKKINLDTSWNDVPVVYTDGACSNNGRNNAQAGWGVYWGDNHKDNSFGPVYGEATNNRGELIAVEKALQQAVDRKLDKVVVKTDSNLLIQSMTKWIAGWKRKGWKTADGKDVKNQDLLMNIDSLMKKTKVKYEHVRGHSGIDGNEKADELARKGAQLFKK